MSKRVLACLAAVVMGVCAAPAAAQTPPPPPVPIEPLLPVVVQSPDHEARVALVRRYFEVIRYDKLMNGTMESMIGPMLADENIPDDKRPVIREALLEAYAIVVPQMMDATVDMYAEAFTLQELQELVAFYESPVGQSLMAKSVILSRQSGEMLTRFAPMMEEEMRRQMCARLDCSGMEESARPAKGF